LALFDIDAAIALMPKPISSPEIAKMKAPLFSRKTEALFEEMRYVEAFQTCAEILALPERGSRDHRGPEFAH
jgi:hypothetical protein